MPGNINGLKIKGRCFDSETDFVFFPNANDRISVVYGKNGTGKSTISESFSCIANGQFPTDLSASLIDSHNNSIAHSEDYNIFVFSEKYIDQNVKIDEDGLGTIILLGNQVHLQTDIDSKTAEIEKLDAQCQVLQSSYDKYLDPQNPLNPQYHWTRIISILKQPGGWSEIDSKIKKNRRNSSVTDEIIREICTLTTTDSFAELQKKFDDTQSLLDKIADINTTYPYEVELINYSDNLEQSLLETLSLKLNEPVLTEREKSILLAIQNGEQDIIEKAHLKFSTEETTICPYCYQSVSTAYKNELVASINKVLNRDVDEHKSALRSISFPSSTVNLSLYEALDSKLVKQIQQQFTQCQEIIDSYKHAIDQKINNIYTPVHLTTLHLSKHIADLNKLLKQLENKRKEFNSALDRKKTLLQDLIHTNRLIAHLQTEQIHKDYLKQYTDKDKLERKLNQKKMHLQNAREDLQKLEQRKSNVGLAINSINNALDYVFFSQGRLSIELKNDKYYLKSKGKDVKPKNISVGERNIIALCYFFTQILSNQEISKLYQQESFVVIDDPISSFDFENKVGIASFLRLQINRLLSGNSKTKILILSHDLETIFNMRKAITEICQSTKEKSGITPSSFVVLELSNAKLNRLSNSHNEYHALLKKVYGYANGDSIQDNTVIGNIMRRVLEAFSTFNYQKSIDKVSCDKSILDALGNHSIYFENLMYRLVLHGESHYEEQVYSIHDGNNFYEYISETEKRKTAKNILCFIYLLNPQHIIAHLQKERNAIHNIAQWVKDIPENKTFEMPEGTASRTIPLYDLPLSAGIGNDSFDGIPSEPYETTNQLSDFALKISGDSMEPRVKDQSIVLIKRTNYVDEGKIGAFYLNGKVYCKYLSYQNENASLCSYNEAYEPIKVTDNDTLVVYGEVIEIIP